MSILSDHSMRVVDRLGQIDGLRLARYLTFVGAMLLVWISLHPFPDLGDASREQADGRAASTYVALGILAVLALTLTIQRNVRAFRSFLTPTFIALGVWLVIDTLFSRDVGLSVQRLFLTGFTLVIAACLPLLPETQEDLDLGLGSAALALLVTCYLGLLLAPSLSMHMSTDIDESHLAGDWRGSFGHKNGAAPIMAMLVFVGLYFIGRRALVTGLTISALSAIFLFFSGGKSATGLCVVTLLLAQLVLAMPSPFLRAAATFLPMVAINLVSVGQVYSDRLAEVVKLLPLDTTFTGRTDVWEFAINSLHMRPFFGYGFAAFWNTSVVGELAESGDTEWASQVSHSHNGYLDTALTIGYPGLALIVAIFVIAPLRNYLTATAGGNDGPLVRLFFRIWLFGVYLSAMESFLLDRNDPIWFTFAFSVFGLHYLSRFPVAKHPVESSVP